MEPIYVQMRNVGLVRPTDRVLGGVCAGLATKLGMDVQLVRVAFVVAVLLGLSPIAYVILWIVMPEDAPAPPQDHAQGYPQDSPNPNPYQPPTT